jgi:hypothetical protein
MRLLRIAIVLAAGTAASFADTITMKNGRVITGTYLGGTAREVRVDVGDQIRTLDVSDVAKIEFTNAAPAPARAAAPPAPRQVLATRADDAAAAPPRAAGPMELPAGTNVVVRMIDGVDSEANSVGQTFNASLDEPVIVNDQMVIPRGADAVIKLVDAKQSGTFTGRAALTLSLVSVKVNGAPVDINTQTVSQESSARGQETAKTAAGGAVLGAVIGAIAGGGKGAAVGATTGGAVGAGAQMVLKGPRVKVPSETRLTFVLNTPVRI